MTLVLDNSSILYLEISPYVKYLVLIFEFVLLKVRLKFQCALLVQRYAYILTHTNNTADTKCRYLA